MIELDFLAELDRFNLALKKHSIEQRQGEQASEHTGQGMVFADHKKYTPGDDIRKIDWKAYARTDDYFIKRFEEERSVTVHLLVDRSTSMDYGQPNKYEYAAKLALGLAYMAGQTNDRYRFSVFSETVTDLSSARRTTDLAGLVDILNDMEKTPESMVDRCLTSYADRIEHTSIVVVLSDFLVDVDQVAHGLTGLQDAETVLVNVLDESELDPDFQGDTILKDPESSSTLRTYLSRRTRDHYRDELQEHLDELEATAKVQGARFVQVSTGDDFFDAFLNVWHALNQ